jgi:hypothetical protein
MKALSRTRKDVTALGDVELAIWVCDEDDPRKIAWWKAEEAPRLFAESAAAAGAILAPPEFYELQPGEDRAGHPPDDIQGTNVRLLVAECKVVGFRPVIAAKTFIEDLSAQDLARLRAATRRKALPRMLTDEECDEIIEGLGGQVSEKLIQEAVRATKH